MRLRFCNPPPPGGGGWGLPYRSDRDACRLALGCKLQILVSLWMFGMESHYICPLSLSTVHYEIYKKCPDTNHTEISLKGQLSLSHTHIGLPYGFNLNFLMSIPDTFIWESPPGNHPPSSCILLMLTASVILRLHVRMRRCGVKFDCGIVFGGGGGEFWPHFIVQPGRVEETVWPSG